MIKKAGAHHLLMRTIPLSSAILKPVYEATQRGVQGAGPWGGGGLKLYFFGPRLQLIQTMDRT